MQDFRTLKVWEKSHALALHIYKITNSFPKEELYGLISQMRRSASSVPTNIAEGCGKHTKADFARFLQISMGSASELEYQIILAHDLNFINAGDFSTLSEQVTEVKRMLTGLIKTIRAN